MFDGLKDSLPTVILFATIIAAFIRLEEKVKYLQSEQDKLRDAHIEKEKYMLEKIDNLTDKISAALNILAKIEGKLEDK